jgi:hypothetical protein
MNTARYWATLAEADQNLLYALAMPTMRTMPRLLTLRYQSRQAGLANREIAGANASRLAFVRWLHEAGRLTDA